VYDVRALDAREIKAKYRRLAPWLDERRRRLWAAVEAEQLGFGGVSAVATATGLSRNTIRAGIRELERARRGTRQVDTERVRQPGGGRKPLTATNPQLLAALDALVQPYTRGDPMGPLRWTCKSTARLAAELTRQGYRVGARTVAALLAELEYSLQANRKTREGARHPDRNAQFEHINGQTRAFQRRGQPVISVDTKKKELVGEFKNAGQEWRPKGQPRPVQIHDFADKDLGKVIPYGVYDLARNHGWVSVGTDHDTPEFAVESIRRWWKRMGHRAYPHASTLLILADAGGSNGYRPRLWKTQLQRLADQTGLHIAVCHFPPGTSKWNKIEHRMFCHITENWRGRPLISHEVIIQLIGGTTTQTGLRIRAGLDQGRYPTGVKVSRAELSQLHIEPAAFHGDWNYTIRPGLST
jgi:DDE family transposase